MSNYNLEKRIVREYYKYVYSDYTLPMMTSNTAPEGSVSSNLNKTSYTKDPYTLWWNRGEYFWDSYFYRGQTIYNQYNFKNIILGGTYTISFMLRRQNNDTTTNYKFEIIDESGNYHTIWSHPARLESSETNISYSQNFTVPNFKAIKYSAQANATSSDYICDYVYNLNIPNLKIRTGSVLSTQDNYDYYIDTNKTYGLYNSGKSYGLIRK